MKNQIIKLFSLSFALLFSLNGLADDCGQIKRRMVTACERLPDNCAFIESCLTRRDTCVRGTIPSNENECIALNKCSQNIAHLMGRNEKCDYEWTTVRERSFCRVRGHAFFFEDGCPGEIGGLLNAFAYGLQATVDQEFSCEAVKLKYEKKVEFCQEQRAEFASRCMESESQDDIDLHAEMEPVSCEYAENFATYQEGDFTLQGYEEAEADHSPRAEKPRVRQYKENSAREARRRREAGQAQ